MKSARITRVVGVLGAAVLATSALSACDTRVGAAAFVGSTRISETTVGRYVARDATATTDSSTGAVDNPKSEVLTTLIRTAIVDKIFATLPGNHPTAAELDTARTSAMKQIGVASLAALEAAAEPAGFTSAYASAFLDEQAKILALTTDLKDPGDGSVISAAIVKQHLKISVSPRYGDWDPTQLAVGGAPAVPSFLKLAPTTAPPVDAAGG